MKDMLSDVRASEPSCAASLRRLGELLRILIHVTAPFRENSMDDLALDPALQEEFIRMLQLKIARIEEIIGQEQGGVILQQIQNLVLLVRLLQFILNFREPNWAQSMKGTGSELAKVLYRLVIVRFTFTTGLRYSCVRIVLRKWAPRQRFCLSHPI
jgi:mediator of RNA polymerase II transcription subunit 12, fungi type